MWGTQLLVMYSGDWGAASRVWCWWGSSLWSIASGHFCQHRVMWELRVCVGVGADVLFFLLGACSKEGVVLIGNAVSSERGVERGCQHCVVGVCYVSVGVCCSSAGDRSLASSIVPLHVPVQSPRPAPKPSPPHGCPPHSRPCTSWTLLAPPPSPPPCPPPPPPWTSPPPWPL